MAEPGIRPGALGDLPELTDIINHYIRETPITFDVEPYTVETRRPWFDQFGDEGPYRLAVAERAGRVVGYAATMRFRPKAAYRSSVETSIYLAPGTTGEGFGRALYARLFEALSGEPVHRALAGMTLPNAASLALHRAFGFESIGVFHEVGWKFDRYWDVEWFEKKLP